MSVPYKRAPIVEAVLECSVQTGAYSTNTAERLRQAFATKYSGKLEVIRAVVGVQVELREDGHQTTRQFSGRIRMATPDGKCLVQFGADILALNALPPYDRFDSYLPAFRNLHEAYLREAGAATAMSYGQRYINRISLPSVEARPTDYFSFYSDRLVAPHSANPPFALNFEAADLSPGSLNVQLLFEGIFDEKPRYMLDLYAQATSPELSMEWVALQAWHRSAHDQLFGAFEASLTDECKRMLGKGEL